MIKNHKLKKALYTSATASVLTMAALSGGSGVIKVLTSSQIVSAATTSGATSETVKDASLTDAVTKAKAAGVNVTQAAGKTITAKTDSAEDVAAAKAEITADYQSQTDALKKATTTQTTENTVYANASTKYKTDLAEFEKKLSAYKNSGGEGVSSSEVTQGLHFGAEPNAKISVVQTAGKNDGTETVTPVDGYFTIHGGGLESNVLADYNDSTSVVNVNVGKLDGDQLKITYSDLKNSYYTDTKGIKHTINHIERTLTNMQRDPATTRPEATSEVMLYNDPSALMWYYGFTSIDVTSTYYDANNNPINFEDGTAYYTAGSLNNYEKKTYHVEHAEGVTNATSIELQGSGVTNHNGDLYADSPNSLDDLMPISGWAELAGVSSNILVDYANKHLPKLENGAKYTADTPVNSHIWDSTDSPMFSYGSGIIAIKGTSNTVRFSQTYNSSDVATNGTFMWAALTTDIPETPLKAPLPPTAKSVDVSYHEDTLVVPAPTTKNVHITKTDNNGKPLANTEFAIADSAENAKAGNYLKVDTSGNVIYPSDDNYKDTALKAYTVTTASDGTGTWENLPISKHSSDTYYVRELKTDGSHELSTQVYTVNAYNKNAAVVNNTLKDDDKIKLPDTGSKEKLVAEGVFGFMALLTAASGFVAAKLKRSKKQG